MVVAVDFGVGLVGAVGLWGFMGSGAPFFFFGGTVSTGCAWCAPARIA